MSTALKGTLFFEIIDFMINSPPDPLQQVSN